MAIIHMKLQKLPVKQTHDKSTILAKTNYSHTHKLCK